jgi:hypothetical protein
MNKLFGFLFMATVLSIFSCQKEDPVIENEQEVITTLYYTLTASGGQTAVFSFQDLDGDGGNAPIISVDSLQANTTYTGQIVLLNETETPADSISVEVLEEDLDHQFFFTTTNSNVSVSYNDLDSEGKPIGLQTEVTTGAAGHGTMTIVLKHEPNKSGANVSSGDMTNAGGETDIEVTFDVHVQ